MTRERAMGNIPRLRPRQWIHLGAPAARQEVSIGPNGDWSMWNQALRLDMGEASKRIPYRRHDENFLAITCDAILDTRESPAFDGGDREDAVRYLEDEWLPVVHAAWGTGPLRYRHQLIATTLTQDYGGIEERTGDETVVLLTKLEIENPTDAPQQAVVNLRVDDAAPMAVGAKGVVRIEPRPEDFQPPEGLTPVRLCISMDAPAGGGADGWSYLRGEDGQPGHLNWQADIGPGATRAVYFKAPYVELLDDAEVDRLLAVRFDAEKGRVCGYWRDRVTHGMDLSLPDKALEAFYKASLWHNMVTSDRDPQTGLYMQGVGTMYYGVYANETVMIARSMDLRGEHAEAERYLEPMLHYQGDMALKGRFASQEGAFHSAGPYTWGEYAMNHGFVLWGVAEHYLLTKDRAYLERVAPKLVAGCEFLIRERATQMVEENGRRAPYYGLTRSR
jgi:hypothetical protein